MAPGDEMLEFTRSFFRGYPDLSPFTHSIVPLKILKHVGRDHLEPEKQALKQLVEEELLKMQADAGTREGKLDLVKVKRSPAPCSDPERKRCRFNSESDSSSTPASPDCSGPPTKCSTKKSCARRALKRAVESTDEEEQTDLVVKMGLEGSSEEEGEDTEDEDGVKKAQKGRAKKKAGAQNKQAPSKASASKQVREESESSEEEAVQGGGEVGRSTGASGHKESEDRDEETRARPRSNRGKRMSSKQKGRAGRRTGGLGGSEVKGTGAVSSGDSSGEEEESSSEKRSEDRTQTESGGRQSAGSEDGEDSTQELATAQGTTKMGINGESDMEREVSDSQAGESTKEERKSRSSKKSSKKGKVRGSSSSSDSSLEPTSQKAGSRRGEDHPAVVRLKRYIRACGAHRNYKKLLGSCRSHKERLSVLRAELEALGMKGNPSLEKCQALKEQREEAAEVASLDVANIISSSGRSRRSNAWNPSREGIPPGELYRRTLDSEEERPRQAPPDWSHMRGIISSDGESS
ncbi:hypothetical protein STEG23_021385 [Scotinomys teguina]